MKTMENGMVKKRIKRHKNMDEYQVYEGLHGALISEALFRQVRRSEEKRWLASN